MGLLRDRRTEGPQDGQRAGRRGARCSVALCIERAGEGTNERTVLSTSSPSSPESSELVSRIEEGETDKP